MPLTSDVVQAVYVAGSDAVVGHLNPQPYDRRIVAMAVQGPANSTLSIYRGYTIDASKLLMRVFPADSRTYDSNNDLAPVKIFAGEAATYAWSGGSADSGATATATVQSQWGRN